MKATASLFILYFVLLSCNTEHKTTPTGSENYRHFDPNVLSIKDTRGIHKSSGQVIYLPVYSNIPYLDSTRRFDLGGILAVHNTDFRTNIRITQVFYLHNDGYVVKDYLNGIPLILNPMEATHFVVPENDKSGTGANFIVEWNADSSVVSPLIEIVMIGLANGQGVSFSSSGKIIAEKELGIQ